MLKINGKNIWSVGTLKAAARKAVARQVEAAVVVAEHKATKKSAVYNKYQQKKLDNPVIETIKIDLSKEYQGNSSISLCGHQVVQCEHCGHVVFDGFRFVNETGSWFTCPRCGKESPLWTHSQNAILVPTFMSVKKYRNGAITVNCFAEQYVVYNNNITTERYHDPDMGIDIKRTKSRLFLAKNKGIAQVIFSTNGQSYVKPFRDLKSGRALHMTADAATKAEAGRYENVTYQYQDEFIFHYKNGKYNFYEMFIKVLEDRHIIPENFKMKNRFPNLDVHDIHDLIDIQGATAIIAYIDYHQKEINMWNVLKKKIGTLPRSITSDELLQKTIKYYGKLALDEEVRQYIQIYTVEALLMMFLFKRTKSNNVELLKKILRNHDFDALRSALDTDIEQRQKLRSAYWDGYLSAEEVPW